MLQQNGQLHSSRLCLCIILMDPVRVTRQPTSSIWCPDCRCLDGILGSSAWEDTPVRAQPPKLWQRLELGQTPECWDIHSTCLPNRSLWIEPEVCWERSEEKMGGGAMGRGCTLFYLNWFLRYFSIQAFPLAPQGLQDKVDTFNIGSQGEDAGFSFEWNGKWFKKSEQRYGLWFRICKDHRGCSVQKWIVGAEVVRTGNTATIIWIRNTSMQWLTQPSPWATPFSGTHCGDEEIGVGEQVGKHPKIPMYLGFTLLIYHLA